MMSGAEMESRPEELCTIIPALNVADTIGIVVHTTLEFAAEVVVETDVSPVLTEAVLTEPALVVADTSATVTLTSADVVIACGGASPAQF